jgi:hypothetical protein
VELLGSFVSILILCTSALAASPLIPEDGRRAGNDHYYAPNERYGIYYEPALRHKRGALISVGSYRALETASYGDFDLILMVDYDKSLAEFNKLNLELIKSTKDRLEYWMAILGYPDDLPLLGQARTGKITNQTFFRKLLANSRTSNDCAICSPAAKKMRTFLAQGGNGSDPIIRHFRWALSREVLEHPDYMERSLFGSDVTYTKIRNIVSDTPIRVYSGNVTGTRTLSDLAQYLKDKNILVSFVDLSNVPEYFKYSRKREFAKLRLNLEKMPLTPDAHEFLPKLGTEIKDQQSLYKYVEAHLLELSHKLSNQDLKGCIKDVLKTVNR